MGARLGKLVLGASRAVVLATRASKAETAPPVGAREREAP